MSEYNARGELIRRYEQTQEPSAGGAGEAPEPVAMAPTLYEYDSFGNLTGQTLALAEQADSTNSPVAEFAYTLEQTEEGVFACTAQTRYNAEGEALTKVEKRLISQLSTMLAEKVISINQSGRVGEYMLQGHLSNKTILSPDEIQGGTSTELCLKNV